MTRRTVLGALAAGAGLAGCSLWSGPSKPKPAELPTISGRSALRTAWSARIGRAGTGFRPVAVGEGVWAASTDGELGRFDAATGQRRWLVNVDKPLVAGVGCDGDLAVVATRDGNLQAFGPDGARKWVASVGSEIVTVPAVAFGLVVVRASDNRISAYDTDTGRRRWSFQRQNPSLVLRQTSAPVLAAGAAYVGLPGGRVVALSLQNGAVRWEGAVSLPKGSNEIERISDVAGTPGVEGRDVCAVTFQGRVACFDAGTGRAQWARDLSSSRGLDMDGRLLVAVDDLDQVQAFSRTGASVWRSEAFKLRGLSAPALALGVVLVGDAGGLVHALSRDDGAAVGRVSTDGTPVLSGPVAGTRGAFVQTEGGSLFALEAE
jgi:outer membrane protein assembly factor BamB